MRVRQRLLAKGFERVRGGEAADNVAAQLDKGIVPLAVPVVDGVAVVRRALAHAPPERHERLAAQQHDPLEFQLERVVELQHEGLPEARHQFGGQFVVARPDRVPPPGNGDRDVHVFFRDEAFFGNPDAARRANVRRVIERFQNIRPRLIEQFGSQIVNHGDDGAVRLAPVGGVVAVPPPVLHDARHFGLAPIAQAHVGPHAHAEVVDVRVAGELVVLGGAPLVGLVNGAAVLEIEFAEVFENAGERLFLLFGVLFFFFVDPLGALASAFGFGNFLAAAFPEHHKCGDCGGGEEAGERCLAYGREHFDN